MARRFLTDIELLGFALQNAKLHPVTSDPAGLGVSDAGRIWFNTTAGTNGRLKVWDGTTAVDLLDLGAASGTITASKVSDFHPAVRTNRLDQMAKPTAPVDANNQPITNVPTPTADGDAANKGYVDTQLNGLASGQILKGSVRVAATANVNIASPGANIDGVAMTAGDVVLLTQQGTATQNGPYVWTDAATPMQRAANWDTTAEAQLGSYWIVQSGNNADVFALLTNDAPITIAAGAASPAPTFTFRGAAGATYTAGAGIKLSGTDFSIDAPADGTIIVGADNVAVNTARVPRKWQGGVPATSTTVDTMPITVTGTKVRFNHGANNSTPQVVIRFGGTLPTNPSGGVVGASVEVDDVVVDPNNVEITLPAAPVAGNYTFMVVA